MLELGGFELFLNPLFSFPFALLLQSSHRSCHLLPFSLLANPSDCLNLLADVLQHPCDFVIAMQSDQTAIVAHTLIITDEHVKLVPVLWLKVSSIEQLQNGSFEFFQLRSLEDIQQDVKRIDFS